MKGFVSGFGNHDWERTHEEAARTAAAVALVLKNGAKCVGRTVMDELAFGYVEVYICLFFTFFILNFCVY